MRQSLIVLLCEVMECPVNSGEGNWETRAVPLLSAEKLEGRERDQELQDSERGR